MSPWHIIILLLIVLLVVGSKRLPSMGRDLGKAFTGFKDGVTGKPDPPETVEAPGVREAEVLEARQEAPAPTPEVAEAERVEESRH